MCHVACKQIIRQLEAQCKEVTGCSIFKFFYSKASTQKIQRNSRQRSIVQYFGINDSRFTKFLPLCVQDIEFGKLGYSRNSITKVQKQCVKTMLSYTAQLLTRNHLQEVAASVISVVEIQREYNRSIPMVISTIANLVGDSLKCEYVSLFLVETSSQKIHQLFPKHCTINSFTSGILGHVVQEKAFVVFNSAEEKEKLGITHLGIEGEVGVPEDCLSVLCVPIYNNEVSDICGILICLDKEGGDPFSHLEVDLLQILSIEIGHILENNATKLVLDDAAEGNNSIVESLLHFYRASGASRGMVFSMGEAPRVSQIELVEEPNGRDRWSSSSAKKGSRKASSTQSLSNKAAKQNGKDETFEVFQNRSSISDLFRRRQHQLSFLKSAQSGLDTDSDRSDEARGKKRRNASQAISELHPSNGEIIDSETEPGLEIDSVPMDVIPGDDKGDDQKESNAVQFENGKEMVPLASPHTKRNNSFLRRRGSVLGNLRFEDMQNLYQHPQIMNASTSPLQQIINMSFDPFDHELTELERYVMGMFTDFTLLQELKVPIPQFKCFIKEIMTLYRSDIPYHNVYHGFSVLSFSYAFIKKTQLHTKFPPLDLFALLIAALCHDVDHPGNTNAFEIATDSELARKHNDQSVLENHHCNVTFSVMFKANCNFMVEFSNEDKKRLRKIVIQSILATDMTHHFELCSNLDQIDKGIFQQSLQKPEKTEKLKQMICNVFVHTADLTAPVQPLVLALKWGKKVCQEFTDQVQKESELGLESLPMMQGLDEEENFLKSQQGFYKFVLRPLFKSVSRLWPPLNQLYLQLLNNEQYMNTELERVQREKSQSRKKMRRASISSLSLSKKGAFSLSPPLYPAANKRQPAASELDDRSNRLDLARNSRESI